MPDISAIGPKELKTAEGGQGYMSQLSAPSIFR